MSDDVLQWAGLITAIAGVVTPVFVAIIVFRITAWQQEHRSRLTLYDQCFELLIRLKFSLVTWDTYRRKLKHLSMTMGGSLQPHEQEIFVQSQRDKAANHAALGRIHTILKTRPWNEQECRLSDALGNVLMATSSGKPLAETDAHIDTANFVIFECLNHNAKKDFQLYGYVLRISCLLAKVIRTIYRLRRKTKPPQKSNP